MAQKYTRTKDELYTYLTDPSYGAEQIAPLDNEYNEDGTVDTLQFMDRVTDPSFSYTKGGKEIFPRFDLELKSNKPVERPTTQQLFDQNFLSDPITEETGDALQILAKVALDNFLGLDEQKLDQVSQDDYKKMKAMGASDEEIWPHLAESKNRTLRDWNKYFSNKVRGLFGFDSEEQGNWDSWNPANEGFGPKASQKLDARAQHYAAGGIVDESGFYVDKYGKKLSREEIHNKYDPGRYLHSGVSGTAVEYNTKEQYEKRKNVGTNWNDGYLNVAKQKVLYEFIGEDLLEPAIQDVFDKAVEKANDPEYQAIQKWSESVSWKKAVTSDWAALTTKMNSTIFNAARSVVPAIATGAVVYGATKNPSLAKNSAALVMTAFDAKSMYIDTYNYGVNELGMDPINAAEFARNYYTTYAAASFTWERLPLSMAFTRLTPSKNIMKETLFKRAAKKVKEFFPNVARLRKAGPAIDMFDSNIGNKVTAVLAAGFAEGLTEVGQYTTEIALQADYNIDKDFNDLWDINHALDGFIGGFAVGGALGTTGGTSEANINKTEQQTFTEENTTTRLDENIKGASPKPSTSGIQVPKTVPDYIALVANEQILVDEGSSPNLISESLANKITATNAEETEVTKLIFNDLKNTKSEENPIRKVKNAIMKSGKGLSLIDEISDDVLSPEKKAQLKDLVILNIKDSEKKIIDQKKTTTVKDDKALENIENLVDENVVDEYLKGNIKLDSIIYDEEAKTVAKSLENQSEKLDDDAIISSQEDNILKAIPTRKDIEAKGAKTKQGTVTIPKTPESKQGKKSVAKGSKYTKESPADKITRQLSEQQSILKTYENKLKKAPDNKKAAIQKDIDKVKARIETLNKQMDEEGLRQQEIVAESKDEGLVDTKKEDIEAKKKYEFPFSEGYKVFLDEELGYSKMSEELKKKIAEDSRYQDAYLKYVSGEIKKGEIGKDRKQRRIKELEDEIKDFKENVQKVPGLLQNEENDIYNALVYEKSLLEKELESGLDLAITKAGKITYPDGSDIVIKKGKIQPQIKAKKKKVEIKQKPAIELDDDALLQQYLESSGQGASIGRIGDSSTKVEGITKKQADNITESIKDTKEELDNINCIKGDS